MCRLSRAITIALSRSTPIAIKSSRGRAFPNLSCISRGLSTSLSCKRPLALASSFYPLSWDHFGTWLDEPVVLPPRTAASSIFSVNDVGCASEIGRRKQNEDRYSFAKLSDDTFFFAIFDGHGGAAAAEFCTRHFGHIIKQRLTCEPDLESVLMKSFLQIDELFLQSVYSLGEIPSSGTTATIALLKNETELLVASVGDSRAILCTEGMAEQLIDDHTPKRWDERERIEQCGGFIEWNSTNEPYVNGKLAMTRSIGDVQVKPFGVVAQPEIRRIELQHTKDCFLILTTDGVSGIMENQELCDNVKRAQDPTEAAALLIDQALQYGSQDNVTTMVIPFGAWGKYKNSLIASSFGRIMIASGRWG
ncbi:protein phosphatase 1K, mitochondrial-like [Rhinatrema bivittatum]|uniref:protein phosphatase 1K, mitochondrial-like n=1 Tax=Rhinatrema bivittatum TaxID=194408 RepID=UPI001126ED3B|nr:protein phosphatase 1K, mitochondrial-like [Rhinatrema bivittatum]XP_029465539.1 protein phosphatase 1K, mitochondrial-like [Rhinatrema bivittatum]